MARLRSPVAVSRSGTASIRWMSSTLTALGRRLTFLGGVTGAAGSVGAMSAETQKACAPRTAAMVRAMEFGPKGRGRLGAPPAVGVSFSGSPAFSDCPECSFPAHPFPARPLPVRPVPAPRPDSEAIISASDSAASSCTSWASCASCAFWLFFSPASNPATNPARGTVGAASSRMKERTCAVVIRSGSITPRVSM